MNNVIIFWYNVKVVLHIYYFKLTLNNIFYYKKNKQNI